MATIFSPSGVGRIFCLPRSNRTPSSSSSFFTAMRQRWLAHVATLGRAAEMLLLRKGDDVAELGEGHGPDPTRSWHRQDAFAVHDPLSVGRKPGIQLVHVAAACDHERDG